jgi:hypothetical protein
VPAPIPAATITPLAGYTSDAESDAAAVAAAVATAKASVMARVDAAQEAAMQEAATAAATMFTVTDDTEEEQRFDAAPETL